LRFDFNSLHDSLLFDFSLQSDYTANVYRDLQSVYREIRVRGFQIYGDCLLPKIPVILKSPHSHFHCNICGEFDFTEILWGYPTLVVGKSCINYGEPLIVVFIFIKRSNLSNKRGGLNKRGGRAFYSFHEKVRGGWVKSSKTINVNSTFIRFWVLELEIPLAKLLYCLPYWKF
jgi:hypothetical protein